MDVRRLAMVVLVAVFAIGCDESGGVTGPGVIIETTRSINGHYQLESLTVDGVEYGIDVGRTVTLNLNAVDRTDMTGTGPCNDYFGEYESFEGFEITDWLATDADCPTEEAIALEAALFEALDRADMAEVDLDSSPPRLVVTGPQVRMVWVEVPPPATQPTRSQPFSSTTTTISGVDPGEVEA